jgi:hypothetical protein
MPKVDLSNYEGREQAYVKHYLLGKYLSRWGYKTGSKWDPLVFVVLAQQEVIKILLASQDAVEVRYQHLFSEAMAFPLVFPDDLVSWLKTLHPNVRIEFAGSKRRRKPSPFEDDRVVVTNAEEVARWRFLES